MFFDNPFKTRMPRDDEYLAGRHLPIFAGGDHAVLGTDMSPPFAETMQQIIFGLGCFWGAERLFFGSFSHVFQVSALQKSCVTQSKVEVNREIFTCRLLVFALRHTTTARPVRHTETARP